MKRLALVLVLSLVGCKSMWQSIKSAAAPAGGAAGGAALGSTLGPVGTIGGAAIGAIVGDQLEENAALRSGEIVGEDALSAELRRWRTKAQTAEYAAAVAETGKDWATRWKWRLIWGGIAYILFLRKRQFAEAISAENVVSRPWALVHALLGLDYTRVKAYGFDPLKVGIAKGP